LVVLLACPMRLFRFTFLEGRLHKLADPFRPVAVESACKHGHDGKQILHQFFCRLKVLGRLTHLQPHTLPTTSLFQVAKSKAHEADQDLRSKSPDCLRFDQRQQLPHTLTLLVEGGRLLGEQCNHLIASCVNRLLETLHLPGQGAILRLPDTRNPRIERTSLGSRLPFALPAQPGNLLDRQLLPRV